MTKDKLQQLKSAYGEIYEMSSGGVTIYCKQVSRGAFKRAFALISSEKTRFDGLEALLIDSVVWPEKAEMNEILEKRPGLIVPFGNKIAELAGLQEELSFRPIE